MHLRRRFIATAAGLCAFGLTLGAAAQTVLKAADVHPAGYPTVVAVENMGKKLEAATNGRIKLQMFPGSVLGGEKEMPRTMGL
jgi:TRAP-type C4-dicarboxylate transport system substrate-binding protein